MEKTEITIVGAGVVGLAVALELSKEHKDVLVIEKNPYIGQETSSRNSEVIHAGIYYPKNSLKTRTCIEGKHLLYEFLRQQKIPYKNIGKLIVAINDNEVKDLENLYQHALGNGLVDLRFILENEIRGLEPNIKAKAAIYSPSTGILDAHKFMENLVAQFTGSGGQIAYNTELIGIDNERDGFAYPLSYFSEAKRRFEIVFSD